MTDVGICQLTMTDAGICQRSFEVSDSKFLPDLECEPPGRRVYDTVSALFRGRLVEFAYVSVYQP
jgi:hypothetical protein